MLQCFSDETALTHIILVAVLAATSAIQAAIAEHKLPAPLPEFKTPEQLAKWRKEMAEKVQEAEKQSNISASAFYTGKPFIEETGTYGFMFRQYDPELNRWTSADPIGFPDGPNNQRYAPIPSFNLDPLGAFSFGAAPTPSPVSNTGNTLHAAAIGTEKQAYSASSAFQGISSFGIYSISYAYSEMATGAVSVQSNTLRNTPSGARDQMQLDYNGTIPSGWQFLWMQVAFKTTPTASWFYVPDNGSTEVSWPWASNTTTFDDNPGLPWLSGSHFTAYSFLALKQNFTNAITIYDNAIKWGFEVLE